VHRTVKILKESRIIQTILLIDSDAYGEYYKLKIEARLVNGWKIHVWERLHNFKDMRIIYQKVRNLLSDGTPHHRQIRTFPYHKHIKDAVVESREVTLEEILEELEKMIKD
jgi:hypothetical protein